MEKIIMINIRNKINQIYDILDIKDNKMKMSHTNQEVLFKMIKDLIPSMRKSDYAQKDRLFSNYLVTLEMVVEDLINKLETYASYNSSELINDRMLPLTTRQVYELIESGFTSVTIGGKKINVSKKDIHLSQKEINELMEEKKKQKGDNKKKWRYGNLYISKDKA